MGSQTHVPGEETFLPRHALPKQVTFRDSSTGLMRAVTQKHPLPVFSNPADLSAGDVEAWSHIHKFGHNKATGTSYVPMCALGVYRTPQVAGATALRIKAGGDANDTAAGTGAREITLEGLDETGAAVSEAVATAGASASSPTSTTFLRLFRAYVSASGTYATQSAGSHFATLTVEDAAGSEDWAAVELNGFAYSQSYIGAYSVPLGFQAFVMNLEAFTDAAKTTDLIFFQRANILETSAPYTAMRSVLDMHVGSRGQASVPMVAPLGPFPALSDIGFLAKVDAGTAEVDVNFEIWLEET